MRTRLKKNDNLFNMLMLIFIFQMGFAANLENNTKECLHSLRETGVSSLDNLEPLQNFISKNITDNYRMIDYFMRNGSTIIINCPEKVQSLFKGKITVIDIVDKKQVELCTTIRKSKEPLECINQSKIFKDGLKKLNGGILGQIEATTMKQLMDDRYTGIDYDKNLKYDVCCNVNGKIEHSKGPMPSEACLAEVGLPIRYACDEKGQGLDRHDPRAKEFNEKYNKIDLQKYIDGDTKLIDLPEPQKKRSRGKR